MRQNRRTAGEWLWWATLLHGACAPRAGGAIEKTRKNEPQSTLEEASEGVEAMAAADMGWLENKLPWTGSYTNKKDDELLIGNISVGGVDPVGIFRHLEKACYI